MQPRTKAFVSGVLYALLPFIAIPIILIVTSRTLISFADYTMQYEDSSFVGKTEITTLDVTKSLFEQNPPTMQRIAHELLKNRQTLYGYVDIYRTSDGLAVGVVGEGSYPRISEQWPNDAKNELIFLGIMALLFWICGGWIFVRKAG